MNLEEVYLLILCSWGGRGFKSILPMKVLKIFVKALRGKGGVQVPSSCHGRSWWSLKGFFELSQVPLPLHYMQMIHQDSGGQVYPEVEALTVLMQYKTTNAGLALVALGGHVLACSGRLRCCSTVDHVGCSSDFGLYLNAGCCKVLLHPTWGSAVYPATLFTTAPLDKLLEAIAEADQAADHGPSCACGCVPSFLPRHKATQAAAQQQGVTGEQS